jgi:hypothetical protein
MIGWIKAVTSGKNIGRMASILMVTLAIQYCEYRGLFANMEGSVLDMFLRHSASGHSPIVIVQIDDVAYKECFASTSPLKPETLESLVNALLSAGPSVLGVDILTEGFGASDPPAYRRLSGQWGRKPRTVWAAAAETATVTPPNFFCWLIGAPDRVIVQPSRILGLEPGRLPSGAWGPSVYLPEEDLRLRKLLRHVTMSADPADPATVQKDATFARNIAEFYCHTNPSACKMNRGMDDEIYFSSGWRIQRFDVGRLFKCPSVEPLGDLWHEFAERAAGSIVLVGGTFAASKDFYSTPVGSVAGLYINAQAVNSEISGTEVAEAPRYLVLTLDLLIGCLIVLIFATNWGTRQKIRISFVLLAATALTSGLLMWRGFVWLTWIGMAVGLCPHIIWELYHAGRPRSVPREGDNGTHHSI